MVKKITRMKAFWASFISALVIGASHYVAHYFSGYTQLGVMVAGATVVTTSFLIGYFGMRGGEI